MKKLLLAALVLVALVGCARTEYGPELTETVVVQDLVYTPATHGTGTGFSSKGSLVVTSVSTRPAWAVVFKCTHGSFIIEREDVFRQVAEGDTLTCFYREEFAVEYEKEREVKRTLTGYDFLRVEKR